METKDKTQFSKYGQMVDVPTNLVELTTEHVFKGGDPEDLNWVKKALVEMSLRKDSTYRWLNCWTVYVLSKCPKCGGHNVYFRKNSGYSCRKCGNSWKPAETKDEERIESGAKAKVCEFTGYLEDGRIIIIATSEECRGAIIKAGTEMCVDVILSK